jgi:hypothetical protein
MALRLEDFEGGVGEAYEMDARGEPLPVTLETLQALPPSGREAGAFRLEWRGPREPVLPQATYSFRRDGRSFEMFVVPVARDDRGTLYEAIFN